MTANEIIAAARSAIGTPFAHQGRIAGKGLDCVGVPAHVATLLSIDYCDIPGYSRTPSGGLLESALDAQPSLVRVINGVRPSDLLVMRFKGEPQHVAILAGDTIIHAYQPAGKVCEHRFTDQWARRVVRVYRFVGVES